MTDNQRKITKQKGVELCADLLFAGAVTREIVRNVTESYGVSRSAVEKWIKVARPIAQCRQEEAERTKAIECEAATKETATKLNLTRERILEEYAKIAFFDIRKLYNEAGGFLPIHELDEISAAAIGGIESYDERDIEGTILGTIRKLKISEKRGALDSICRVMGYNAPTKIAPTDGEGKDIAYKITLNLNS